MEYWTYILLLLNVLLLNADMELPVQMASCVKRDKILNDCNWCTCNDFGRYICKTRECQTVDMSGHFKDAIADIDVGMQGHGGVWRSTVLACEPNVLYQRDYLACVCADNGTWPSAECRDAFRVLYRVEVSTLQELREDEEVHCEPTKLYVVGCNVCLCDSRGILRSTACTKRTCDKSEASVFEKLQQDNDRRSLKSIESVYAQCVPELKYKLDCRSCICMRINRLICVEDGECENLQLPKTLNTAVEDDLQDFDDMHGKCDENKFYKKDCNICHCHGNNTVCTVRKCNVELPFDPISDSQLVKLKNSITTLSSSSDSHKCGVGHYKKDCNICFCLLDSNNKKIYLCTKRSCGKLDNLDNHCAVGTVYESNCRICSCLMIYGDKWETCQTSPECDEDEKTSRAELSSLRGYCVPGHIYQHGCNTCKCSNNGAHVSCSTNQCNTKSVEQPNTLTDTQQRQCTPGTSVRFDCNTCYCSSEGIILGCTKKSCSKLDYFESNNLPANDQVLTVPLELQPQPSRDETFEDLASDVYPVKPIPVNFLHLLSLGKYPANVTPGSPPEVNIVPIASPFNSKCPSGHSYRIRCNYCFCLSNGNALCTLRDCDSISRTRNERTPQF